MILDQFVVGRILAIHKTSNWTLGQMYLRKQWVMVMAPDVAAATNCERAARAH